MQSPEVRSHSRLLVLTIVAALILWGSINAVSAYRLNHDLKRPLVVLVCMAVFLAFWMTLLWYRKRQLAARASSNLDSNRLHQSRSKTEPE